MTDPARPNLSVQPDWCRSLPIQQQSVLFLAARGPDGVPKFHPCKGIVRAYRACVLKAAYRGRTLAYGEGADNFMALDQFASETAWAHEVSEFFAHVDSLPHHYYMHLMHGAEILGYHHPDERFRSRWIHFYYACCSDLHLTPEDKWNMDLRLNDWGRDAWDADPHPLALARPDADSAADELICPRCGAPDPVEGWTREDIDG